MKTTIEEYFVYILLCCDGSYYTGYTQDLKNRLKQHMSGNGSRYTRMKKSDRIVYTERFNNRLDAMKREKEIKRLRRCEKSALINRGNVNT